MSTPAGSSTITQTPIHHHCNQVYPGQTQGLTVAALTTAAIVKVYPQLHHYPEMLDSLKPGGENNGSDFVGAPLLSCTGKSCKNGRHGDSNGGRGRENLFPNCNAPGCESVKVVNEVGNRGGCELNGFAQSYRNGEHGINSDESSPLTPRTHPYSLVPMKSFNETESDGQAASKEGKYDLYCF